MCWKLTTRKRIDTGCIIKHVQDKFNIKNKNSIKLNTNIIYSAINIYKVQ